MFVHVPLEGKEDIATIGTITNLHPPSLYLVRTTASDGTVKVWSFNECWVYPATTIEESPV